MNSLMTLLKKELLEQIRTKKILILTVVFLFIAISSPITAKLMPLILKSIEVSGMTITIPDPTYMDAIDQFVKNISQLSIFVIIFLVAGSIADEKNNKTLEIVLTKPISRDHFILSKFFSYAISLSLLFIAASLFFYFYTVTTFTSFSFGNFSLLTGIILIYILSIVFVTIFASSFMKNTVSAAAVGFVFMILSGPILGLFKYVRDFAPNLVLSNYKEVILNGYQTVLTKPILSGVFIIVVSIVLSVLFFRKQEIER